MANEHGMTHYEHSTITMVEPWSNQSVERRPVDLIPSSTPVCIWIPL